MIRQKKIISRSMRVLHMEKRKKRCRLLALVINMKTSKLSNLCKYQKEKYVNCSEENMKTDQFHLVMKFYIR